jgi:hypothetical protein
LTGEIESLGKTLIHVNKAYFVEGNMEENTESSITGSGRLD